MSSAKVCNKCGERKPLSEFHRDNKSKDGRVTICKSCNGLYQKEYRKRNSDILREKSKRYNEANKEKRKNKSREYYIKNRDRILERTARYRDSHRAELKKYFKDRYKENKKAITTKHKIYYEEHREERLKYLHNYYRSNKQKSLEYSSKRNKERLANDPVFKAKRQWRLLTWRAFNKNGEVSLTYAENVLGCSPDFFTSYLKKTWESRYGAKWSGQPYNIDHIIPLLKANTIEEVKELCHYTNVRLLTPEDNMRKGLEERKKYEKKY